MFDIYMCIWYVHCTSVITLTTKLFKHCPFLSGHAGEVDKILDNWKTYKMSVPTYGGILLDPEMKYVTTLSVLYIDYKLKQVFSKCLCKMNKLFIKCECNLHCSKGN